MNTSDLVSVIIPIFNAEPYLDQALNSVRGQDYSNLEILCLNDGSTDNSLAIMCTHAKEDPRITVIDKENQGYGATCNRGIAEAHGTWIAILEPDDWIEQDMYQELLDFAAQFHGEVDIVKSAYWRILMPDTPQQRKLNCDYKNRIHPPQQPFAIKDAARLLYHHPSIWSALYRKSFLDKYGIRFRELPGAGWADNPFLIETLCQTDRIVYLDKAYYCYREETPEKTLAFARQNTLLPLERWNDMTDLLEQLHVTDESVLRAHNIRGFTYLNDVVANVGLSHDGVREAARQMFLRMNPDLVFSDPDLSPSRKEFFAELRGTPCPPINRLAYLKRLIGQGFYILKNNGIGFAMHTTGGFLARNMPWARRD